MTWADTVEKGRKLLNNGMFAEAQKFFENASGLAEDDHQLAISTNNLAIALANQKDYKNAEEKFDQALSLLEPLLPDSAESYGVTLVAASEFYAFISNFQKAADTSLKQVNLTRSMFGPRHPYVALIITGYAEYAIKAKDIEPAEKALTEALEINEAASGPDDEHNAAIHSHLSNCYVKLKKHDLAEKHLKRAMEIKKLTEKKEKVEQGKTE